MSTVSLQCCARWVKQAACRTYQVLQGNIDILLPGAFTLCRRPGHCHHALSLLQLPSAMQRCDKHITEALLHVCLHSCTVALCIMLLFELHAKVCRCLQDPCISHASLCTACRPSRLPGHCLQTAMARRFLEMPALMHSMLSALMSLIASHASTISQPEAAKPLSAEGCGAASTLFLSHLSYHADHADCTAVPLCLCSQNCITMEMAMPDPLHVSQFRRAPLMLYMIPASGVQTTEACLLLMMAVTVLIVISAESLYGVLMMHTS